MAWLVLCSLWLGAVGPALSHALVPAPAAAAGWVEVCTTTGARWIRWAPAQEHGAEPAADTPGPSTPVAPDCERCSGHPPLHVLPTADTPAPLLTVPAEPAIVSASWPPARASLAARARPREPPRHGL